MEAIRQALGKVPGENNSSSSSSSSSLDLNRQSAQLSTASGLTHSSLVLTASAPRQDISYWACSKLCAVFFAAGVVFGYTLRRRVRSWVSKVLKRLTDN